MVRVAAGRAENGHDPVPQILIHVAPIPENHVGHGREILVQQLDQRLRLQLFRNGREAGHVREGDGQLVSRAAQFDALGVPHDLIHHLGGHVFVEHGPQHAALPAFREIFHGRGDGVGQGQPAFRERQVQPESVRGKGMHGEPVVAHGEPDAEADLGGLALEQHEPPRGAETQDQGCRGKEPVGGRPHIVAVENIVQGRHVDQHARRERRERGDAEVVGAGGGRGNENDLVAKQRRIEERLFAVLQI